MKNLTLALIAAHKRALEMEFEFSGGTVQGIKQWYETPYFQPLDKATVKSIWKHYLRRHK